jgi:hypothetical protein
MKTHSSLLALGNSAENMTIPKIALTNISVNSYLLKVCLTKQRNMSSKILENIIRQGENEKAS